MNILDFKKRKQANDKISFITCYDYSSAQIVAASNIDCILVGDSLAMTIYGYPTTLNASVPMMAGHIGAVARGLKDSKKFIVGDMPFSSYRKGIKDAVEAASELMIAGAHAVKLEGAIGNLEIIKHLVDGGIPVMGHLGLTPQFINQLGGYRIQGKSQAQYDNIINDAKALEDAGCFSLVLECVPAALGKAVTEAIEIPTIGIGAGKDCDGQVLVWQDALGINKEFKPRFVRVYDNGFEHSLNALNQYVSDTKDGSFPNNEESY